MKKYGLLFLVILEAGVSFVLQGAERERRISIQTDKEDITLSEKEFEELKKASEPIRDMLELFEYVGGGVDVNIPLLDVAPETVRLLLDILASPKKMTRLEMDQLIPLIKLYDFLKLDHKDLVDKEASLTDLFKQIGTQYKLDIPPDSPCRLPDDPERLFLQFYLRRHAIERTLRFNGSVNSVALSGDGTIAMAGSHDSKAQIYDVKTGTLLHTLQFDDHVSSVALSADGKVAMAGSWDKTAQIYDVRTGRLLHTLRFNGSVRSVALSRGGTIAMAGSADNTAQIYDGETGTLHTLRFNDGVYSVALSQDGTIAMAGSHDKTAQIYDVRPGTLLRTLQFSGPVYSVALSADGKVAMAGSGDKTAQIYDVRTGRLLNTLQFDNLVPSVALSQDGTIAMAGDGKRPIDAPPAQIYTAQIYDGGTGKLHTLRFNDGVYSVALSQDGTIAIAGSHDKTAKIYDVRAATLLRTLRFTDSVSSAALSQDGTIAMAGSWNHTAEIVIIKDDLAVLRDVYSRMTAAGTTQASVGAR